MPEGSADRLTQLIPVGQLIPVVGWSWVPRGDVVRVRALLLTCDTSQLPQEPRKHGQSGSGRNSTTEKIQPGKSHARAGCKEFISNKNPPTKVIQKEQYQTRVVIIKVFTDTKKSPLSKPQ